MAAQLTGLVAGAKCCDGLWQLRLASAEIIDQLRIGRVVWTDDVKQIGDTDSRHTQKADCAENDGHGCPRLVLGEKQRPRPEPDCAHGSRQPHDDGHAGTASGLLQPRQAVPVQTGGNDRVAEPGCSTNCEE